MAYPEYMHELEALKAKLVDVNNRYKRTREAPQMSVKEANDVQRLRVTVLMALGQAEAFEDLLNK